MDFWLTIFQAGIDIGTILLFATIGEIICERAGVLNLGVEGMMLLGAMTAYSVSYVTKNVWLGLLAGILAAGIISQIHAFITITLQADQVVSGLSLNFLATGISLVFGENLTSLQHEFTFKGFSIPLLSQIPILGKILFTNHSILIYLGLILFPLVWWFINRTRPGMSLRAIGEYPAAADAQGINVFRMRYFYVFVGGLFAGLAGGAVSLDFVKGFYAAKTTGGLGWIAVGLVIFSQWDPMRAAVGSFIFGALRRLELDIQIPEVLFGVANPFFYNPYLNFFVKMLPYIFTIVVLIIGSREAMRKRIGSPAALGLPYIRGQRGL